jgi:hypothetical protein
MIIAIVLVVLLLVLWYCGYMPACGRSEGYRSCRGCDGMMSRAGTLVINPYVWPYSGANCIDDLYISSKDSGIDFGFGRGPLTHLNTPDHVELIN